MAVGFGDTGSVEIDGLTLGGGVGPGCQPVPLQREGPK
jgi:hypothetical protein